jgi:hypothetical protein
VYLSTNNGTNWTQVNNGLTNYTVFAFTVNGTNIYAGTEGGVFLSTINGTNWSIVNITATSVEAFTYNGTNIYTGTNQGVFLSTNNGTNWTQANNELTNVSVNSLAISGSNIFAGVSESGVYLSTNNGANWTQVNNGIPLNSYVYSLTVSGTNIFANISAYTGGSGIYLSTNNGTNWTQVNNGIPPNTNVLSLAVRGSNIFAGTSRGIFLSTNNGTNWTSINNGLTDSLTISSLNVSGNNIYAGTAGQYPIWWVPGRYSEGVFISTNNGTNWVQANNGLPLNYGIHSLAVSGNSVFAGLDSGVFRLTNNSTNWTKVSDGLTRTSINALAVIGTNIFAGTSGSGVWMRPLSELTGVSNEVKTLPQEFTLSQNYPNPFNPTTVIKYEIPFESKVNVRFYNSLGQIVRDVNEGTRQPGNYEINFNSSGLASGVYFYSIMALSSDGKNDFSAVKKMILLK